MPYCTLNDLKEKVPEATLIDLTDDENTGAVVTSRIDRAIADADAEIDGYCAGRYSVPLNPVPAIILKFSVDIAIYNLMQRKESTESWDTAYKNAIRFLKDVAKGSASLGVHPPPDPPGEEDTSCGSLLSARDKMFDIDTMEKY